MMLYETFFFDSLFTRALVAGLGLCLITGPLGCFLIWRRMAFFGDALSHSALLGIALAVFIQIEMHLGILIICILVAGILSFGKNRQSLPLDTWLAIISYGALACGVIALSKMGSFRFDPFSYLFGDILALSKQDLLWIYTCSAFTLTFIIFKWRQLLLMTVDEELAQVGGVPITLLRSLFMGILALSVAVALKTVGFLLVPALLIIPAAAVSQHAQTPEHMIVLTTLTAGFCIIVGLWLSFFFNIPPGATIVVSCLGVFLITSALSKFYHQ